MFLSSYCVNIFFWHRNTVKRIVCSCRQLLHLADSCLVHVSLSPLCRFPAHFLTSSVYLKAWLRQVARQENTAGKQTVKLQGLSRSCQTDIFYMSLFFPFFPSSANDLCHPSELTAVSVVCVSKKMWNDGYETWNQRFISLSWRVEGDSHVMIQFTSRCRHSIHFFPLWFFFWFYLTFLNICSQDCVGQ